MFLVVGAAVGAAAHTKRSLRVIGVVGWWWWWWCCVGCGVVVVLVVVVVVVL